jgi:hypothetical protein
MLCVDGATAPLRSHGHAERGEGAIKFKNVFFPPGVFFETDDTRATRTPYVTHSERRVSARNPRAAMAVWLRGDSQPEPTPLVSWSIPPSGVARAREASGPTFGAGRAPAPPPARALVNPASYVCTQAPSCRACAERAFGLHE